MTQLPQQTDPRAGLALSEPTPIVPRPPASPASSLASWLIVTAVALAVIGAAVWFTPAGHRLLVAGLALVAFAVAFGVDWTLAPGRHAARVGGQWADRLPLDTPADLRSTTTPAPVGLPAPSPEVSRTALSAAPLTVTGFTRPKDGNAAGDNEDSYSAAPDHGFAAISDGASSSIGAREWSQLLTDAFVSVRPPMTGDGIRAFLQTTAAAFASRPVDAGANWWGEDALRTGAFATFLGFRALRTAHGVAWEAAAIGDSIVVHLRREGSGPRLMEGFPLEAGAGFAGSPSLVGSVSAQEGRLPAVRIASGTGLATDRWLLLTDEVAAWALRRSENGNPVWSLLLDATNAELDAALTAARRSGELANDDLTVLRLGLVQLPT